MSHYDIFYNFDAIADPDIEKFASFCNGTPKPTSKKEIIQKILSREISFRKFAEAMGLKHQIRNLNEETGTATELAKEPSADETLEDPAEVSTDEPKPRKKTK